MRDDINHETEHVCDIFLPRTEQNILYITQTRIIVTLISLHFTSDHERVKGEAVSFVNVTVFPPIRFPDFVRSCRAFLPQAYATSPNANAAFSLTERLAAICVK